MRWCLWERPGRRGREEKAADPGRLETFAGVAGPGGAGTARRAVIR